MILLLTCLIRALFTGYKLFNLFFIENLIETVQSVIKNKRERLVKENSKKKKAKYFSQGMHYSLCGIANLERLNYDDVKKKVR